MLDKLRSKLTYANVVTTACLFVVLGGSSVAAPVGGAAKKLITGTQIKDNSLTNRDVRNGSLLSGDFKTGQLPAGPQGPKGDKGDKGAQGLQGEKGLQGDKGVQGEKGLQGIQGIQGIQGMQGTQGVQGTPGTAKAYAFVNSNGTPDATRSAGVSSVVRPDRAPTGVGPEDNFFCFNLTFDPKIAVASAFANNAGIISTADMGQSAVASSSCTSPNDDAVVVTRGNDGSDTAVGFSVIFE